MHINIQPIEKLDRASDGSLEVHSIYQNDTERL
jgi:hypothetical protein